MIGRALCVASLVIASAPFQCASDPDPARAREETPGEALYRLAEKFRAEGDEKARRRTLHYLVDRYPSSRFAQTARDDLEAAGDPPPERPDE